MKKVWKNIWKVENKVFIFAASKTGNDQRKRWGKKPDEILKIAKLVINKNLNPPRLWLEKKMKKHLEIKN